MIEKLTEEISQLLGKNLSNPELQALLRSLDANEKIEPNPDSGGVYVSRPNLGFSLLLTDPARIANPAYSSMPRDLPVLTACFYYSEGHHGYSQFSGNLPGGLQFLDSRSQILTKLGEPAWKREKNGRTIAEKWIKDGQSIHITYKKNHEGILIVAFGIEENF